jgi:hypothetical protein
MNVMGLRRLRQRSRSFREAYPPSATAMASGWDPEFVDDAEDVFVREVEPAVQEIEDAVRDSSFVAQLLPSMTAPQNWAAGGALGMAAYNLASLPELASLAVGGGVGFASGVREAYLEWRKGR